MKIKKYEAAYNNPNDYYRPLFYLHNQNKESSTG